MSVRIEIMAKKALKTHMRTCEIDKYKRYFDSLGEIAHIQKKAECIKYYLNNNIPEIDKQSLIIGEAQISILNLIPGFNEEIDLIDDSQNHFDNIWIFGGNHKTANFDYVIKYGINAYYEKIKQAKNAFKNDTKKISLLNSMATVLDGICEYVDLCVQECAKAAANEKSEKRKKELQEIAQNCKAVPLNPAASFYQAVQSYWFVFMLFPDGLGRLDQYLYPYYIKDLQAGKITKEFARELIECLFICIFRLEGIDHEWSGRNHLVVGGYRSDGSDGYNELTEMIISIIEKLPTYRPQVTFRRTKHTTFEQLNKVVEAMKNRYDLIMITNDETMIDGIMSMGIEYKDAVEYSLSGCNEMVITGMSQMGSLSGHLNVLKALEKTLYSNNRKDTFADFYSEFEQNLKTDVQEIIGVSEFMDRQRMKQSDILASVMTDRCIEKGLTISEGGAKYNGSTWIAAGLINAADSLYAIKKYVYDYRKLTICELARICKENWRGYEDIRADILKSHVFFGNDNDEADNMVNTIIESLNNSVGNKFPLRGGRYTFGTLVGYELSHIRFGKNTGATPDGRYAHEELTASICSTDNKNKNGVIGFLKSVTKLNFRQIPSAVVVNLTIDKSFVNTYENTYKLTQLIDTYLKMGGVQLQINFVSQQELIDAQKNPEEHKNLRVRVTGFSGYFTSFDKELQNEIIERANYHD